MARAKENIPLEAEALVWMEDAACRTESTDVFFPHDVIGVEAAKKICKLCDVRIKCLDYALDEGIVNGVWGGTSERERVKELRNRRAEASQIQITKKGTSIAKNFNKIGNH